MFENLTLILSFCEADLTLHNNNFQFELLFCKLSHKSKILKIKKRRKKSKKENGDSAAYLNGKSEKFNTFKNTNTQR